MANLQYIGARYVPKFYENSLDPSSMEWEANVGYEPLTVVTFNNDTYTSKIPVPPTVGNPAANPTYWAKTADYNAALVVLQNQVNDNTNDIADIQLELEKVAPIFYEMPNYPRDAAYHIFTDTLTSVQGGCVLPDGRFVQYLCASDDSAGKLVLFDADGNYLSEVAANCGHGNDVTWSSVLNRLIVTDSATDSVLYFFTITGTTMALDSTKTMTGLKVQGICAIDDVFYIYDAGDNTLKKTSDFVIIEIVANNFALTGADYLHQGIATDGEYIYWLARDNVSVQSFYLVYKLNGTYVDGVGYPEGWGEGEWIDFHDNMVYFAASSSLSVSTSTAGVVFRRDYYRNKNKAYNATSEPSGGVPIRNYVYFDNTLSSGFKTGQSATHAFSNEMVLLKCAADMNHCEIRCTANTTDIDIADFNGGLRIDNTNPLTSIAITTSRVIARTTLNAASITINTSEFIGRIASDVSATRSLLVGRFDGTVTGDYNVASCTITGTSNNSI